jgi:hypothetical protein
MNLILFLIDLEDVLLPCINKKIFGFDCMGCGFQRAILFLIKGDFVAAFKMYPAIYTLIFLGVYILLNLYFKFKKASTIIRYLAIINIIIIIGNYIIKMNS